MLVDTLDSACRTSHEPYSWTYADKQIVTAIAVVVNTNPQENLVYTSEELTDLISTHGVPVTVDQAVGAADTLDDLDEPMNQIKKDSAS